MKEEMVFLKNAIYFTHFHPEWMKWAISCQLSGKHITGDGTAYILDPLSPLQKLFPSLWLWLWASEPLLTLFQ